MDTQFTHLHNHSTFSLGDAVSKIKDLPKRAAKLGMKSLAITDHGTMAGVVEFNKECHKNGVKPILGMEAYIAFKDAKQPVSLENPNGHIVLLARNLEGYANLCKLLRIASRDEHFNYVPRIDMEILSQYSKGLIGLTACIGGIPQKCIVGWSYYDPKLKAKAHKDPNLDMLPEIISNFKSIFEKDCYYLEVQNHKLSDNQYLSLSDVARKDYDYLRRAQTLVAKHLLDCSKKLEVPAVITNDCHYLTKEDRDVRKAILANRSKKIMEEAFVNESVDKDDEETEKQVNAETKVVRELTGQMYLKSPEEMKEVAHYNDYPFLMDNTLKISEMCENYSFSPEKNADGTKVWNLPEIDTGGKDIKEYFRELVYVGFNERFPDTFEEEGHPHFWKTKSYKEEAVKRLEYELSIMNKLRLESYHIVVADVVHYAKDNNILVGPGRGSAAGSIVVYCLGITDIDPIRHGLLFSRYLNPERVASAADIDVDYDPIYVDQIYNYIRDKYGAENVCRISTYSSILARGAVRILGRVMNLNHEWVNRLANTIPESTGDYRVTLKELLEEPTPAFKSEVNKFIEEYGDKAKYFLDLASRMDDIKYAISEHAAGVLISKNSLSGIVPLVVKDRNDPNSLATEIEYDHLEDLALLKQDLLVVFGLSIVDMATRLIRESNPSFSLPLERDELYNDKKAYDVFSSGRLTTIWQMSSPGMRSLCVNFAPSSLAEIAAICALYRPGPLNFIDPDTGLSMTETYVARKNKELPVKYDHPGLIPALEETYGVIVYQEQIMKICCDMCGWTDSQADYLRKAVGKKKKEEIQEQKTLFIPSIMKHSNISLELATKIWDQLATFGEYGFNKSHSYAYGKLSYQMAYLKAHYPIEYITAAIHFSLGKSSNAKKLIVTLHDLITEANHLGITILPPDIFKSKDVTSFEGNSIRLSFNAVENIASTADRFKELKLTQEMDFSSVVKEMFAHKFNKKHITYLIKANAFEKFGNMNMLISAVNKLAELRSKKSKKRMEEFFNIKDDLILDPSITTTEKEVQNNISESLGLSC